MDGGNTKLDKTEDKGYETSLNDKKGAKPHPIFNEDNLKTRVPQNAWLSENIKRNLYNKIEDDLVPGDLRSAFAHELAKIENEEFKSSLIDEFVSDFQLWLQGRSEWNVKRYNVGIHGEGGIPYTPWGAKPLFHIDDVRQYLEGYLRMRSEFQIKLAHLLVDYPRSLEEAWIYYKYLIRGASLPSGINELYSDFSRFDPAHSGSEGPLPPPEEEARYHHNKNELRVVDIDNRELASRASDILYGKNSWKYTPMEKSIVFTRFVNIASQSNMNIQGDQQLRDSLAVYALFNPETAGLLLSNNLDLNNPLIGPYMRKARQQYSENMDVFLSTYERLGEGNRGLFNELEYQQNYNQLKRRYVSLGTSRRFVETESKRESVIKQRQIKPWSTRGLRYQPPQAQPNQQQDNRAENQIHQNDQIQPPNDERQLQRDQAIQFAIEQSNANMGALVGLKQTLEKLTKGVEDNTAQIKGFGNAINKVVPNNNNAGNEILNPNYQNYIKAMQDHATAINNFIGAANDLPREIRIAGIDNLPREININGLDTIRNGVRVVGLPENLQIGGVDQLRQVLAGGVNTDELKQVIGGGININNKDLITKGININNTDLITKGININGLEKLEKGININDLDELKKGILIKDADLLKKAIDTGVEIKGIKSLNDAIKSGVSINDLADLQKAIENGVSVKNLEALSAGINLKIEGIDTLKKLSDAGIKINPPENLPSNQQKNQPGLTQPPNTNLIEYQVNKQTGLLAAAVESLKIQSNLITSEVKKQLEGLSNEIKTIKNGPEVNKLKFVSGTGGLEYEVPLNIKFLSGGELIDKEGLNLRLNANIQNSIEQAKQSISEQLKIEKEDSQKRLEIFKNELQKVTSGFKETIKKLGLETVKRIKLDTDTITNKIEEIKTNVSSSYAVTAFDDLKKTMNELSTGERKIKIDDSFFDTLVKNQEVFIKSLEDTRNNQNQLSVKNEIFDYIQRTELQKKINDEQSASVIIQQLSKYIENQQTDMGTDLNALLFASSGIPQFAADAQKLQINNYKNIIANRISQRSMETTNTMNQLRNLNNQMAIENNKIREKQETNESSIENSRKETKKLVNDVLTKTTELANAVQNAALEFKGALANSAIEATKEFNENMGLLKGMEESVVEIKKKSQDMARQIFLRSVEGAQESIMITGRLMEALGSTKQANIINEKLNESINNTVKNQLTSIEGIQNKLYGADAALRGISTHLNSVSDSLLVKTKEIERGLNKTVSVSAEALNLINKSMPGNPNTVLDKWTKLQSAVFKGDITNQEEIKHLFEDFLDFFGRISAPVSNNVNKIEILPMNTQSKELFDNLLGFYNNTLRNDDSKPLSRNSALELLSALSLKTTQGQGTIFGEDIFKIKQRFLKNLELEKVSGEDKNIILSSLNNLVKSEKLLTQFVRSDIANEVVSTQKYSGFKRRRLEGGEEHILTDEGNKRHIIISTNADGTEKRETVPKRKKIPVFGEIGTVQNKISLDEKMNNVKYLIDYFNKQTPEDSDLYINELSGFMNNIKNGEEIDEDMLALYLFKPDNFGGSEKFDAETIEMMNANKYFKPYFVNEDYDIMVERYNKIYEDFHDVMDNNTRIDRTRAEEMLSQIRAIKSHLEQNTFDFLRQGTHGILDFKIDIIKLEKNIDAYNRIRNIGLFKNVETVFNSLTAYELYDKLAQFTDALDIDIESAGNIDNLENIIRNKSTGDKNPLISGSLSLIDKIKEEISGEMEFGDFEGDYEKNDEMDDEINAQNKSQTQINKVESSALIKKIIGVLTDSAGKLTPEFNKMIMDAVDYNIDDPDRLMACYAYIKTVLKNQHMLDKEMLYDKERSMYFASSFVLKDKLSYLIAPRISRAFDASARMAVNTLGALSYSRSFTEHASLVIQDYMADVYNTEDRVIAHAAHTRIESLIENAAKNVGESTDIRKNQEKLMNHVNKMNYYDPSFSKNDDEMTSEEENKALVRLSDISNKKWMTDTTELYKALLSELGNIQPEDFEKMGKALNMLKSTAVTYQDLVEFVCGPMVLNSQNISDQQKTRIAVTVHHSIQEMLKNFKINTTGALQENIDYRYSMMLNQIEKTYHRFDFNQEVGLLKYHEKPPVKNERLAIEMNPLPKTEEISKKRARFGGGQRVEGFKTKRERFGGGKRQDNPNGPNFLPPSGEGELSGNQPNEERQQQTQNANTMELKGVRKRPRPEPGSGKQKRQTGRGLSSDYKQ